MICCGMDMGKGEPIVVIQYWCKTCNKEHWANAEEMTEYVQRVHREANNGVVSRLPDLL
jgi:hypothetical protein